MFLSKQVMEASHSLPEETEECSLEVQDTLSTRIFISCALALKGVFPVSRFLLVQTVLCHLSPVIRSDWPVFFFPLAQTLCPSLTIHLHVSPTRF
jgi:hypothetical protein